MTQTRSAQLSSLSYRLQNSSSDPALCESTNPSERTVCDILLSTNVRAIKDLLLSSPSGLLITGANRLTRQTLVKLVVSSISIISICDIILETKNPDSLSVKKCLETPTGETYIPFEPICIDDVDFPDARVETYVKALFPTLGLTHIIIGLAATDASVPASLRRAGRFDVIHRITAPSFDARKQAWESLLSTEDLCFSSEPLSKSEQTDQLAACSPGYGLSDFANALYGSIGQTENTHALGSERQAVAFGSLLKAVSSQRPIHSGIDLPFIASGGHAPPALEEKWSGHGGYETAKDSLIRLAEWPVRYAKTFSRLGIRPPHGVLLHGPGGCGKTLLAQRFVEQLKHANWLYLSADNLFSKYLGDSELRVRNLFGRARELTPCVIVLDDIDGVGRGRMNTDGDGGSGVESRVLATLLTELDGVQGGDVFVVACARELTLLDAALLRPGRLDEHIEIGLPRVEDREAIARIALDRVPVEDGPLGLEGLVKTIARCTEGLTGAAVFGICREAAMLALEENSETSHVPRHLFYRALSTFQTPGQSMVTYGSDLHEKSDKFIEDDNHEKHVRGLKVFEVRDVFVERLRECEADTRRISL